MSLYLHWCPSFFTVPAGEKNVQLVLHSLVYQELFNIRNNSHSQNSQEGSSYTLAFKSVRKITKVLSWIKSEQMILYLEKFK